MVAFYSETSSLTRGHHLAVSSHDLFFVCHSKVRERRRERGKATFLGSLLTRALIPWWSLIFMASPNLRHLPKAPSPNTITFGVKASR